MQILYLLVLGDKSNVLYGKDLCFNANYRFKHEFIDGDEDKVKVSWEIKNILPDNFFTTRENNKKCCIENISEIIGVNGSGKTLILKTLFMIATNNLFGKYILIYKKDKEIIGYYGVYDENEYDNIIYKFVCTLVNYCIFSTAIQNKRQVISQNGHEQYGLAPQTDLVYLCNHYCFTWHNYFVQSNSNVFDYSTAGLIISDFKKSKLIDRDTSTDVSIISHQHNEMKRIINLLYYLQEDSSCFKFPKSNLDNYNNTINNIKIKKYLLFLDTDILFSACQAARQIIQNEELEKFYFRNDIIYLAKKIISYFLNYKHSKRSTFYTFFCCFIASSFVNFVNKVENHLVLNPDMFEKLFDSLTNYLIVLEKMQEKIELCNFSYTIKEELINEILKTIKENESFPVWSFFYKLFKYMTSSKNINDNISSFVFDFSDKETKNTLFKLFNLYINVQQYYPFIVFRFEPPISSGELSFLTLWARLYDYLENNHEAKHAIIFIDEAETTLHPEWQKALCQSTISFIEDYCKARKRKLHLHIIFASHSPMLMSDVPTGNVVFLDKDKSSDDLNKTDWKTFAGDIFEIYQKGFFLKNGSIGNFALSKVDGVIQHISQGNISDDDRKIIDMIGDGLITNYFHRIIDKQSSSSNDSQK